MFASRTYALFVSAFAPPKGVAADLLGVHGTFELCKVRGRVDGTKEYGFVLVHAGIGEQQGRI